MGRNEEPGIVPYFSWTHFATEGKFDNITDALEETAVDEVVLGLIDPTVDPALPPEDVLVDRLARCKAVIANLKKDHGIAAGLALPGLLAHAAGSGAGKKELVFLLALACQTKAKTLWLNDGDFCASGWYSRQSLSLFNKAQRQRVSQAKLETIVQQASTGQVLGMREATLYQAWIGYQKKSLLVLAKAAERTVAAKRPGVRLGLIAAKAADYGQGVRALELAEKLAGQREPLLTGETGYDSDEERSGILDYAQTLLAAPGEKNSGVRMGRIDAACGSNFLKSAEASQMQVNLNLLLGRRRIVFGGFDETGTAPGSENPFLKMQKNRSGLIAKLGSLIGEKTRNRGVGVVVCDRNRAAAGVWCKMLWRIPPILT